MFELLWIILHCASFVYASLAFPINFFCLLFISLFTWMTSADMYWSMGRGQGDCSVLLSLLKIISKHRKHSFKLVLPNWRCISESLRKHFQNTHVSASHSKFTDWKISKSGFRHVYFVKTPHVILIHYPGYKTLA